MSYSKMPEPHVAKEIVETGHELSDLNPKSIAIFGVSLALTIIAVILVCYGLSRYFFGTQPKVTVVPGAFSLGPDLIPGPRLEVTPGRELTTTRAEEEALLSSYAWIDREKGIVRIPIKRAMEIVAQKGLPARARPTEQVDREGRSTNAKEQSNGTEPTK